MIDKKWWKSALFLVVIFIAGCGPEYVYYLPDSVEGMACVAKCKEVRSSCYERQENIAQERYKTCKINSQNEVMICIRRKEIEYNSCREDAKFAYMNCLKTAKEGQKCKQKTCTLGTSYCKDNCSDNAAYGSCYVSYDSCFIGCGGSIEEKE